LGFCTANGTNERNTLQADIGSGLQPVRRMCGAIPTYGEEVPPRDRFSVLLLRRGDGGLVKPSVCSRLSPVQVYCVGRHHANRCVPTSWCGADAGEETRDHSLFRSKLDDILGVLDVWKSEGEGRLDKPRESHFAFCAAMILCSGVVHGSNLRRNSLSGRRVCRLGPTRMLMLRALHASGAPGRTT